MHLTTQEIPVQNLEIGMYVSRLDIPWVQTPFPIQGFYITKQDELDLLAHYCNFVYVDSFLSKVDVSAKLLKSTPPTSKKNRSEVDARTARLMSEKARMKPRVEDYPVKTKMKKEVKVASTVFTRVTSQMAAAYRNMDQTGFINVSEFRTAANDMVKSIVNNPNALAWLCRLSSDNKALHQQAVRSAVWGIIFARHLGLSKHDLRDIGTALLLAPIGKSKLPRELLYSQQNQEEVQLYQQHITLTLEETQKIFSSSHQVNYILGAYCERNNGSGYPKQLVGNRIPFLARVAGLADYYESLINPFDHNEARTPVEAISHLYSEKGMLFQVELVEQFIQAVGIYPTGSLVRLSNNSVGVVVEQPEKSRLRPRIAIVKDGLNNAVEKSKIINLADNPKDEYGLPLQIDKSLKSTSLDVSSEELHDKLFGGEGLFGFLRA
ncbi:DUF3391 domain-containing protein [Aliikangiella sp. G2MR2-5]|uniref:HD-GYP domain-containing protein n=1 Tax=Aliikangiella sp. G2MR2-5 TaxID=2788943 RepID=UPI0018AB6273|nr:HD domain-containing phosphohydrolase [Aliikangiella sp. G2MR2-5]